MINAYPLTDIVSLSISMATTAVDLAHHIRLAGERHLLMY
jgi:hypothetical protein